MLVEGWARDGLTDEQISHNIGIAPRTVCEWKKKYAQFAQALKKGREVADRIVENALYKRALGYEAEETTTEIFTDASGVEHKRIKRIKKHIPADTTAQIFWLKNRRSKYWRDRPAVDEDSDALVAAKILLGSVESAIN